MRELTREEADVIEAARRFLMAQPGVEFAQRKLGLSRAVQVLDATNQAKDENKLGLSIFLGRRIEEWFDILRWLEERCVDSTLPLVQMAERVQGTAAAKWLASEAAIRAIARQEIAEVLKPLPFQSGGMVGGPPPSKFTPPSTENFARGGLVDPKVRTSGFEGPREFVVPLSIDPATGKPVKVKVELNLERKAREQAIEEVAKHFDKLAVEDDAAPWAAREVRKMIARKPRTAEERVARLLEMWSRNDEDLLSITVRVNLEAAIREAESAAWDRAVEVAQERTYGDYAADIAKLKGRAQEWLRCGSTGWTTSG